MYTREEIDSLLQREPSLLVPALLALYDLQSGEEKRAHKSLSKDHLGFNKFDAEKLIPICERLRRQSTSLQSNEEVYLRERVLRYSNQLVKLVNNELKMRESDDQRSFIFALESANEYYSLQH